MALQKQSDSATGGHIQPIIGRVSIEHHGLQIASSSAGSALFEDDALQGYVLPESHVVADWLIFSDSQEIHPLWGSTTYWSLYVDGIVWKDVAWRYARPPHAVSLLGDVIIFDAAQFDVHINDALQAKPTPKRPTWISTDDRAVIDQVQAGSSCAVRLLHDRFHHAVYALALRITQDTGAAADVTQQVFLEASKRAHQWNPERGRLSTWLLAITRYTALDVHHRRTQTGIDAKTLDLDDDLLDARLLQERQQPSPEPEAWFTLADAIAELPAEYRQVIEAIYLWGQTHSQAAAELHLPLGTVKTRVRLALRLLRERRADFEQ